MREPRCFITAPEALDRLASRKLVRWTALAALAAGLLQASLPAVAPEERRFVGPTSSQPLALSADDSLLVVANPDNDSVTFFDTTQGGLTRLAEVAVGREPNGVALSGDGKWAYVANTVDGTVSVLRVIREAHVVARTITDIEVGTEPYGMALTPNGRFLYVTNARSNSISVLETRNRKVETTIENVGEEPRGIAITNDGDGDDDDETAYVAQFLALPVEGKLDGADDSKVAFVTAIDTGSNTVLGQIQLDPVADTGFKALGDALARIPPGANFIFTTGAYPNQLNNIAVKNGFAYVPNTAASPNGPVRFDVNTHSLLHVINRATHVDAGQTLNMHTAVRNQTGTPKLFITQPWAIAFKHHADEGYVASAASNILVKLAVDPNAGAPAVQVNPLDPTRVLQIPTGKNPRGIAINSTDSSAYVTNYVSRDVSVIDLTSTPEQVVETVRSAPLPAEGTLADKIQVGKELYHTSVGEFDPAPGSSTPIRGRMSNNGWGACSACHPFGLTDNVVWIFAAGPRRTIPQHTDFDRTDPTRATQRALNWSAIFDEEEDFEGNIRGVSGGLGLIVTSDGVTQDVLNAGLGAPNGGRNQLKVRGVPAWDAIKAFIQFGIRAPISPISSHDDVQAGLELFSAAGCQMCHGGPQWTSARVRFPSPPPAAEVVNGQLRGELKQVGTFDPAAFNEVRANAAAPLGADGFAPPSLLSVFAFPQTFLHNGAQGSLDAVLDNVTHRSAGTGGIDTLADPVARQKLVAFLKSIDSRTTPIP